MIRLDMQKWIARSISDQLYEEVGKRSFEECKWDEIPPNRWPMLIGHAGGKQHGSVEQIVRMYKSRVRLAGM